MSNLEDPRVLFAAERTLLAWNRTSLALMAFGFVIERFEVLMRVTPRDEGVVHEQGLSFWVGLAFILLGAGAALNAVVQYRRTLRSLQPAEIPPGYGTHGGIWVNVLVALLGVGLVLVVIGY